MRLRRLLVIAAAVFGLVLEVDTLFADWPMRGHDVRRTGRANVKGPRQGTHVWQYVANDGGLINIEAAVTGKGVYFGTWGQIRKLGAARKDWDKFDGKIYGLATASGKPLWKPLHPGVTPYAYRYDKRAPTQQDKPAGSGMHWNWYNGTVEGTPAVDPRDGTLYVGRGDGCLWAVDPARGRVKWKFLTIDPARPDDPEGGGEVVGGPLITKTGLIVFATFAAPHRPDPPKRIRHETNAVYAVNRSGKLVWRHPPQGTVEAVFSAPVALSVDGKIAYAVTHLPHAKFPCELFAIDVKSGKLRWRLELGLTGGHDLAVGIDGVLYLAGSNVQAFGSKPVAFAVRDRGKRGELIWGPVNVDGIRPKTHFAAGIAVFEANQMVSDVFVSTSGTRNLNSPGGQLHRIDPANGKITATWNPAKASPSCEGFLTDVSLDDEGVIYVGVRGRWKTLTKQDIPGRMYALRRRGKSFEVLWSFEVDGQLDWASPAIGPRGGFYFGSSSRLNPVLNAVPRRKDEDVSGADPIFYGIRD
jgi:outer membrane protein assembly factor BamB